MHKRNVIGGIVTVVMILAQCTKSDGQQSKTSDSAHKNESTNKSLLAVQNDVEKSILQCFVSFQKWSNQLHLSEFNTDYGTERALRDRLDTLRDTIDIQKQALSAYNDGSLIDPLVALEMLKTVHHASVDALLFSTMQVNLPNKETASGLAGASRSCSSAHDSLASYLALSIALK